ncbi:MAG: DUF1080 domain-containing protein [Cytophagaceae bacterium]|jgi:hypothetical protein|nr:DUF1080 domain-containing protein [Cytophagaceae bacterium]
MADTQELEYIARKGTAQDSRALNALNFDYIKIDERSFKDLLVFAQEFARLINFYNLKNKVDGNWSELLTDESIILASMADADPTGIEERFKNNFEKAVRFKRKNKKIFFLENCLQEVHQMASLFSHWQLRLRKVESNTLEDTVILNEIDNAIFTKLAHSLQRHHKLCTMFFEYSETSSNWYVTDHFDKTWTPEQAQEFYIPEDFAWESHFDFFALEVQEVFQSFYETLIYLKIKSPEYLEQSLKKDNHFPEVALFLAFLRIYQVAQGDINQLSKRHLDFYYEEVLKQEFRKAQKDQVYLSFTTYDNVPFANIKKGEAFLAGTDSEGRDIVYNADQDLRVNKAHIGKLRNFHIPWSTFTVGGKDKKIYFPFKTQDIPASTLQRNADMKVAPKSFAAFGESDSTRATDGHSNENARLGFSVSSPVLFMKEGYRDVYMTMQFESKSFKAFENIIDTLAEHDKVSSEELFVKAFLDAFVLRITTPGGWYKIGRYVVSCDRSKQTLRLAFDLTGDEPAISSYLSALHGKGYDTPLPVLEILFNHNSYLYPYILLKDLFVEEISISVDVKGVRDLSLVNNLGPLNPENPFYPFGPIPSIGSYLMVGNNEVFQKTLDDLKLHIEWFDLPRHNSGFFGYYEDYNIKLDNTSFEVQLSILDQGRWKPEKQEDRQVYKLFRTVDDPLGIAPLAKSTLSNATKISEVNLSALKLAPNYSEITSNLKYTSTSHRGFIRLELTSPEHAFGHQVYPGLITEVTTKNAQVQLLKFGEKKNIPMPKPAHSPQMKSIILDYKSSAVISLRDRSRKNDPEDLRGEVYHLHPYGWELVYPDTSKQLTKLVPEFNYEGALYFGFRGLVPPDQVNLLVEMQDEFSISSEQEPPEIEWYYLANNEWKYLRPSRILRDDTNGFIKTGIITLDIPSDINTNNTLFEKDCFWVRATVIKNSESASRISSIYTQAITATLKDLESIDITHLDKPLAPFSIERSVSNIEGIQSVLQPLESMYGIGKEKEVNFYIRVSERLKHKNRALMPWDYERMVLDQFPAIYKAACLPNMTSESLDAPGSVLMVVTSHSAKASNPNEPIVSSELLYQIKAFLSKFISPFVKIEVRNPSYERIKIICSVAFTEGFNYGYHLQKLNEDLNKYISNSLATGSPMIELGGRINTSDILTYMRTLPYVDFITKFSMVQAARDFNGNYVLIDTAREGDVKTYLQASKPWSVLVPALEHQITVQDDKNEMKSIQSGIDSLELGHDFIIE